MNRLFTILCVALPVIGTAQIHELGVSIGGSNAITDVGSMMYVNPNQLTFGAQYRYNRSVRHSWRISYDYIPIFGDDQKSSMPLRKTRGLSYKNTIQELSAGIEFNFLKFDLHEDWFSFTPYIYTGISGISFKDSHYENGQHIIDDETIYTAAIPLNFGVKIASSKQLVLSAEVGVRYTFTDHLDGSNSPYPSANKPAFGETSGNDWFVNSKLTLTYTFGENPCYCLPAH